MSRLKNRSIGFYIGLVAALLAIVSSIIFVIVNSGDRTFSILTVIFILLGAIVQIVSIFFNFRFMSLFVTVFYALGLSIHFNIGLETLSDVWNGVNYIGGNANAVIVFGILFFISTLLSIVSNFMKLETK